MPHTMAADALEDASVASPQEWPVSHVVVGGGVDDAGAALTLLVAMHILQRVLLSAIQLVCVATVPPATDSRVVRVGVTHPTSPS